MNETEPEARWNRIVAALVAAGVTAADVREAIHDETALVALWARMASAEAERGALEACNVITAGGVGRPRCSSRAQPPHTPPAIYWIEDERTAERYEP
jgi:hypothetical protein